MYRMLSIGLWSQANLTLGWDQTRVEASQKRVHTAFVVIQFFSEAMSDV